MRLIRPIKLSGSQGNPWTPSGLLLSTTTTTTTTTPTRGRQHHPCANLTGRDGFLSRTLIVVLWQPILCPLFLSYFHFLWFSFFFSLSFSVSQ